ncbi:hypothetical protein K431DRAFT_319954 [Polychaeton citri CBS 116435]|uniref:GPI transamidase component PIG-T n=1 Tax=Polychaeton citri CBS 116435 TaxID=1314669 RepID=A0A9P4QAC8_9PEZI|nr:hypothetical protein K431DRAFT_319954 [Polychaeton citri CBS 116435]
MKLFRLLLLEALLAINAQANTEKAIFVAPQALATPDTGPSLADLHLDVLSPSQPALRTLLPVVFPNEDSPQGVQHWYLLLGLSPGQRHELKLCWAAIQPTAFWLDTFDLIHVFDTPDLIQSLAAYADSRQGDSITPPLDTGSIQASPLVSALFVRVKAAADFYTSNKTLMQQPPPVLVDLILDPYLLNIFPRSLVPTAAYITFLAAASVYISGRFWKRITPAKRNKGD